MSTSTVRPLRRVPGFGLLWSASTVSLLGTQVTLLALPLLALLELHSSTTVVGLLTAAEYLPWLLLSLPAGLFVDRHARRPVMVACDLARVVAVGAVPVVAAVHRLTVPVLLALVLLAGAASVVFELASTVAVPEVVGMADLSRANGALQSSLALATVGGPALAGALVGVLGAANALTVDVASFAVSAVLLARLHPRERPAPGPAEPWRTALLGGVRVLRADRLLRVLCAYSASFNLVANAATPVLLTFLVRRAHLSPSELGLVLTLGAVGALVGAVLSDRTGRLLGTGRALGVMALLCSLGNLALSLVPASRSAAYVAVPAIALLYSANTVYNALMQTVRAERTPPEVLGRVTAAWRTLSFGAVPVGAATGGVLADAVGLRPVMVGAALVLVALTALPCLPVVRGLGAGVTTVGAPA